MRGVRFIASALAAATLLIGGPAMAGSGDVKEVELQDRCDPVTFTEILGPGSCLPIGKGGLVTFFEVDAAMRQDGGHPKWAFSREEFTVKPGAPIKVKNVGGEAHTFTKVSALGTPGCVPPINEALGFGLDAGIPECASFPTELVFAGTPAKTVNAPSTPGTYFYICLIHPWMESTVTVKA